MLGRQCKILTHDAVKKNCIAMVAGCEIAECWKKRNKKKFNVESKSEIENATSSPNKILPLAAVSWSKNAGHSFNFKKKG